MQPFIFRSVIVACLLVSGCSDDVATETTTSGGATSTSTSSGAPGPMTAAQVAQARCAGLATDTVIPLDGSIEPPTLINADGTVYEMALYQVNEPTQFVGRARVDLATAGKVLVLTLQTDPDNFAGGAGLSETEGGPSTDVYTQCDACLVACDEVENAFVYDVEAGSFEVGISGQEVPKMRLLVQPVEE